MKPSDDDIFEKYLQRGSRLSQQYRDAGAAEVPAALDRKVLSQARAALERANTTAAPRAPQAWRRWSAPLALAAAVTLAVMIAIKIGVQQTEPASEPLGTVLQEDAAKESAPAVMAPPPPAESMKLEERVDKLAAESEMRDAQASRRPAQNSAQGFAPAAPPVPASADAASAQSSERAPEAKRQAEPRPDTSASSGSVQEPPTSSAPAVAAGAPANALTLRKAQPLAIRHEQDRMEADPKRWLEHIRSLRERGETAAADEELKRFKAAWPDYPVEPPRAETKP